MTRSARQLSRDGDTSSSRLFSCCRFCLLSSHAKCEVSQAVINETGEGISDCIVTLEVGTNGALHLGRRTDDAGKFSFGTGGTAGGCAISVEKSGYETQTLPCPLSGNMALHVTLRRSAEGDPPSTGWQVPKDEGGNAIDPK
jgi:hypothetical protein